jgi:1-acyl-sn-glycerol-3-phosphate acyltransferase
MAKQELFIFKPLGWLLKSAGCIPIKRGKTDISSIKTCINILKQGNVLGIFPEGTRKKAGINSKPKTGAALLSLSTGIPIIPIGISSTYKLFKPVKIVIGKPKYNDIIEKPDKETLDKITNEVMEKINELVEVC